MNQIPDNRSAGKGDSTNGPHRSRRLVALVIFCIVFAALLTEAGARLLHLGSRVYVAKRIEPDGRIPWEYVQENMPCYRANTVFSSVYDPAGDTRGYFGGTGRVTYEINQYGFRGPALPVNRRPGTLRVLCLGDSFTFGEGVRDEDTYAACLQKPLAACFKDRQIEIINAGAQAYSTVEEGVLYMMRCQQFKPDIVTLGFVLNDAMTMQQTAGGGDAMTKDHAVSGMARYSRVLEILERSQMSATEQDKFFTDIRVSFDSEAWDHCKVVLASLNQSCRKNGSRFLVVIFPVFYGLEGNYPFADIHAKIIEACRAADCECLDLLEIFLGRKSEDLWAHPTDHHPNEIAHRLAAERIAKALCKN